MLNDKVLPFYEQHELPVLRILTDRGTEYCGRADRHDYQLFLAINDIDHTKTKVKSPQTNGICERFHKTILQEFYQVTFRKKIYETIEQLGDRFPRSIQEPDTDSRRLQAGCRLGRASDSAQTLPRAYTRPRF